VVVGVELASGEGKFRGSNFSAALKTHANASCLVLPGRSYTVSTSARLQHSGRHNLGVCQVIDKGSICESQLLSILPAITKCVDEPCKGFAEI
jgi:hypothetical protein